MPMSAETRQRFEQEEQAYWQQREELLKQYEGKWVAIVGGQVVAVGDQMNKVAAEAFRKTQSGVMFVTLVGEEDVEFRIRQVTSGYFDRHHRYAIPMVTVSVTDPNAAHQVDVDFVVDTGADLTVLRSSVADALNLWLFPTGWARISGFDGRSERRLLCSALVHVAKQAVPVAADCRDDIGEDILGRDVINEFALTVCAKREQVEFEWVEEAQHP